MTAMVNYVSAVIDTNLTLLSALTIIYVECVIRIEARIYLPFAYTKDRFTHVNP